MEVSYNLRYQKSTFSNRILVDKEGEIIIYEKGFRLKGKGASDKGELINFSDLKEFYYRDDKIFFITFSKEKYVLADAANLFDQLLKDIYKSRNEFLLDALFMRGGKLKAEFEGYFDRLSKFSKPINKGNCKMRLYERSMVVMPEDQDAFAINFSFVNFYEFDDMEYSLKIVMDDGQIIFFSHLGEEFEMFEEKMNSLLGGMYQLIVNDVLRVAFAYFSVATLLKFAYLMKAGKTVALKDIMKIDKELAKAVDDFIFEDPIFREKMSVLRSMVDEYDVRYGIAQDDTVKSGFVRWFMIAIPSTNIVAFSILPRWEEAGKNEKETSNSKHDTYFYRIIMEKGNPADKVEDKIKEVEQALVTLNFVKDPCYKDKRDLKHSPYQYAIRKMPFLRILRKSFIGVASSEDVKEWQKQSLAMLDQAKI